MPLLRRYFMPRYAAIILLTLHAMIAAALFDAFYHICFSFIIYAI